MTLFDGGQNIFGELGGDDRYSGGDFDTVFPPHQNHQLLETFRRESATVLFQERDFFQE